jgi:NitT/TauT family transport system substrate-binding protein
MIEQGQPAVERLVHSGWGSVVASEGDAVGAIPFSAYLTTPAFTASHAKVLQRFAEAYYHAQQWIAGHSAEEISQLITPSFPGGGFISKRQPYAEHVNTEFAQAAMRG